MSSIGISKISIDRASFGTLNTELLPELPGYLKYGKPTTDPKLSLAELDRTLGTFLVGTYNARVHREIRVAPQVA